ncbi:MAG: hypothetical protein GXO02_01725 [Epsilonproteobacteria bacterium]|nr:hypothetical protein [Campylobacterota bacterium]
MRKKIILTSIMAIFLIGCGGGGDTTTTASTPPSPIEFTPNDGRLLASNCYGCHGTNGVSITDWDSIAGEDNLHEEMFESDGIMLAQAKGYSDEEIAKMEEFLKSLSDGSEEEENKEDD